jgi:NAD(P)H dehydrogenase (quinone)
MKHAIILAHPERDSFNASVAKAYAQAVEALGHTVVLRDLYAIGFDPCLRAGERPDRPDGAVAPDIAQERALIGDADIFVLVYPIWFGAPPAMMKGYVERVFNHGFAFENFEAGRMRPLLSGRRLISFTSSGSTKAWMEENGLWLSLRHLFDSYISKLFGLEIVDHMHFPSISPGLDKRWILENLQTVRTKVRDMFGAQSGRAG